VHYSRLEAISSGLPARPMGTLLAMSVYACSFPLTTSRAICVSMRPGLTAFTSDSVLDVFQRSRPGQADNPCLDAI
jgi:hypothetical protein